MCARTRAICSPPLTSGPRWISVSHSRVAAVVRGPARVDVAGIGEVHRQTWTWTWYVEERSLLQYVD